MVKCKYCESKDIVLELQISTVYRHELNKQTGLFKNNMTTPNDQFIDEQFIDCGWIYCNDCGEIEDINILELDKMIEKEV